MPAHTAPAAIVRHAIGTVVRITGDTTTNLGRLGEVVDDQGGWYRLRVDQGPAVLFRHAHVEVVEGAEAHALRVELRAGRVDGLVEQLAYAEGQVEAKGADAVVVADITEGDVAAGLRTALAEARAEFAAAEVAQEDARVAAAAPAPTTGRGKVLAAAEANGWTVREFGIGSVWIDRGRLRVTAEFSVTGAVTYASGPGWRAIGKRKAERVLAELAR